jgi:hypothetical protein
MGGISIIRYMQERTPKTGINESFLKNETTAINTEAVK